LGAFLEPILIVANIGTAVVLFPILKRQSASIALGYIAARVVESAFIAVGILSLLVVVTLRRDLAGGSADPATLETVGRSLVAIHNWTFLLGPGFVVASGTGCCSSSSPGAASVSCSSSAATSHAPGGSPSATEAAASPLRTSVKPWRGAT
jgi:Domain of unknown function (DUF4386)